MPIIRNVRKKKVAAARLISDRNVFSNNHEQIHLYRANPQGRQNNSKLTVPNNLVSKYKKELLTAHSEEVRPRKMEPKK